MFILFIFVLKFIKKYIGGKFILNSYRTIVIVAFATSIISGLFVMFLVGYDIISLLAFSILMFLAYLIGKVYRHFFPKTIKEQIVDGFNNRKSKKDNATKNKEKNIQLEKTYNTKTEDIKTESNIVKQNVNTVETEDDSFWD